MRDAAVLKQPTRPKTLFGLSEKQFLPSVLNPRSQASPSTPSSARRCCTDKRWYPIIGAVCRHSFYFTRYLVKIRSHLRWVTHILLSKCRVTTSILEAAHTTLRKAKLSDVAKAICVRDIFKLRPDVVTTDLRAAELRAIRRSGDLDPLLKVDFVMQYRRQLKGLDEPD